MKTKNLFNFILSLSLAFSPVAFAKEKSKLNFRPFRSSDVKTLSSFKTTHQLAKAVLKRKDLLPNVKIETKKILEQKQVKLSGFKVNKNELSFMVADQLVTMKYISGTKYKINSEVMDLSLPEYGFSNSKSAKLYNFLIHEAHAWSFLARLVGGGIAGALATGCVVIALSSVAPRELKQYTEYVYDINFFYKKLSGNLINVHDSNGCEVHADSFVDNFIDAESVISAACEMQKKGLNPQEEFTNHQEKYELQVCTDAERKKCDGNIYFGNLSEYSRMNFFSIFETKELMDAMCANIAVKKSGTSNIAPNAGFKKHYTGPKATKPQEGQPAATSDKLEGTVE
jgi:hypothetical protein